MRLLSIGFLAAVAMLLLPAFASDAHAGGRNPDGYGIYTPSPYRTEDGRRLYRYDQRSWYYAPRGYYPHYGSGYWVPRAEMRHRYRYRYVGPRYQYYPAWGYY